MVKERMSEVKTAAERKTNTVVVNSLEEYVRELSQRMILPKGKIESFRGILASPDQLAPLVEKTEDTRIELKVTTPSQTRFSISSDIKVPKRKEKLKTSSRSVQLASLAEAEARFRVIKNSEHIPDQVRYAGFNLDRTISKLHKQSEKLIKGEKVFGKTKAEKKIGIIALSLAAAACGKVSTPIQPASVEPVATEVAPTPIPTEEASPTPTEIPPSYKTEDGVQLEKQEEGEFVDLFPGSDVFMSERGDIVIINEETNLQLAGQKVETPYGSYTILVGDTQYQYYYKHYFNETTKLGGYMNIAESPLKDELGRIYSTLVQLEEKEIIIGSVNLATYQSQPKDLVMIYMNAGTTSRLADSLPEGLMDPSEVETIYANMFGFPLIKTPNEQFLLARFTYGYSFERSSDYAQSCLEWDMSLQRRVFSELVVEAAVAQGVGDRKSIASWAKILNSPFQPLFSNPQIIEGMDALKPYSPGQPVYTPESFARGVAIGRLGSPGLVTVDFDKLK